MFISLVIPSYNRRNFLAACLDSVFAQHRLPDEVIVVDDGSTDGTVEELRIRSDLKLVTQVNAGPGAARNRGAAEAHGDYIAFLDSDDLWFPWSLQAMIELIERHGEPALLFAQFEDFTGEVPVGVVEEPVKGAAFRDFLASAGSGYFAGAGMMVIRRETFLAAGGFAEERMNAEDHDLALRLCNAPGFVQVTQPVIVAHRMHGDNEMADDEKNLSGLERLIASENGDFYPGGVKCRAERRKIIASHVRSAVLNDARHGGSVRAAILYRDSFLWSLKQGRIVYLAAAPALAGLSRLLRRNGGLARKDKRL